ncbi:hypothetical protein [Sediminibacterium sp.]|uniref:hypothetical protein n=1 Tax=Sediminibacterium sp. TaxID=1917865 RepID=UPI002731CA06|nr:hypothetical protein [Sediminibacterium sp.]MDP2421365.1 hypothetical protein [Sediminibacterium sp.]
MKKERLLVAIAIVIATSCNNQSSDNNQSKEMNHDGMGMGNMKMDSMKMDSTMHSNHQMMDSSTK